MQRLFSMFPKGAPGIALLLMRFALSLALVEESWLVPRESVADWERVAAALLAASLCAGLLTPLMCALCVVAGIAAWTTGGPAWQPMPACVLLNAVALALLGPGAYS